MSVRRGRIPRRAHAIAGDYFLLFTLLFRSVRLDDRSKGGVEGEMLRDEEGIPRRLGATVAARGRIDLIPRHEKCPPV